MNEMDELVDKILTGVKTATCAVIATAIFLLLTLLAVYGLFIIMGFEVIQQ